MLVVLVRRLTGGKLCNGPVYWAGPTRAEAALEDVVPLAALGEVDLVVAPREVEPRRVLDVAASCTSLAFRLLQHPHYPLNPVPQE